MASEEETPASRARRLTMEAALVSFRDALVAEMREQDFSDCGFTIIVTDFQTTDLAYASNVERQSAIRMLREILARLERGA